MNETSGIAVVINTLNEEANIGECIDSVRGLAQEIVVCDMHSDDRTVEIARQKGARIVLHARTGFVEPARRFAIAQARCQWVLVLDADERMTPALAARLKKAVEEEAHDVVSFWSLYWYFGGWVRHGGFFSGHWRRLFRKEVYLATYAETDERVHQNFDALKQAKRILQLPQDYYIEHYAYATLEKYLSKTLGTYARIEGEQYVREGRRFSLVRMIGEPLMEVPVRFLWLKGYRDGMRGFVLACLFAGYRFCVWANVWYLQNRKSG
ncbi:MAG: hypothetical protein A3G81_19485 [Betaproteobacteria bacterium RIFCSPLOWO2_12_FULL_65_14]|nr:MAG: hypothetical protein A3G81_19485 [Betaproteobacteria bacterium RIFCSPLOWO2_12_FULL_65_14]